MHLSCDDYDLSGNTCSSDYVYDFGIILPCRSYYSRGKSPLSSPIERERNEWKSMLVAATVPKLYFTSSHCKNVIDLRLVKRGLYELIYSVTVK